METHLLPEMISSSSEDKKEIELRVVDESGYLRKPCSLMMTIFKNHLPCDGDISWFKEIEFSQDKYVNFTYYFDESTHTIEAELVKINSFVDGFSVVLDPLENTLFYNWKRIVLWISYNGYSGILNPSRKN